MGSHLGFPDVPQYSCPRPPWAVGWLFAQGALGDVQVLWGWAAMARCRQWCPLCYSGVRGRKAFSGHAGFRGPAARKLKGYGMGMLKRPVVRETGGLPALSADSPLAKSYPALFAFLCDGTWEDGTPRETGTAMLLFADGLLKLWLHDRNGQGSSSWVSGEALEDVLAAADDNIASGAGEWRIDRPKTGARRPGRS